MPEGEDVLPFFEHAQARCLRSQDQRNHVPRKLSWILKKKAMNKITSSEITPEHIYLSRRAFMRGVGALAASSVLLGACAATGPTTDIPDDLQVSADSDELGDALTSYAAITTYNNYYEFSTDKAAVARLARDFRPSPWEVTVGGLVRHPQTFDVGDLQRRFGSEERIYRLRCVEGWSMVIPWVGFPLAALLKAVEPETSAQYVRMETIYDPQQMPGQNNRWYNWPYIEGLRLDEAMHDLTLLATGIYGKTLTPQNGAPVRLVVPWKYGFKSIKAIVRIDLVETMPTSLWMLAAPQEYGFYANVNPDVPHPRWSQSTERRIGESGRRPTLPFNGYAEQVAALYAGMDLKQFY